MNIYDDLASKINDYYSVLKKENSFFKKIFSGTLEPEQLELYLFNMKASLKSTIVQCKNGAKRCEITGDRKLRDFFLLKAQEEVGHDQWAEEDLENIYKEFTIENKKSSLSIHMVNIIEYNNALIEKDPRLYLVFMMFAEYFTVIAGPECIEKFNTLCNIPTNCVSVIEKHATLDQEHVHEWHNFTNEYITDIDIISDEMFATLEDIMKNYARFCSYVGDYYENAAA